MNNEAGKKDSKPAFFKQAAELLSSSAAPVAPKPRLYNWVRAIRKISLISAYFSCFIILLCIGWAAYQNINKIALNQDNSLMIGIFSTILLTSGLRKIGLRKLQLYFLSNRNFEFLLGFWCLTLLIIHFLCQLLALAAASLDFNPYLKVLIFIFSYLLIGSYWPELKSIQKLLK